MAAALGVALEPGQVAMSIGTSGTVYTVSDEPTADPKGYVAGFADATGRFLPLACTLNAMRVIDTFARLLQGDLAGFDQLALAAKPGPAGSAWEEAPAEGVGMGWGLGRGERVEPGDDVESRAVRAAYAELRERYYATS